MPTYAYTCPACGSFEASRPVAEAGRPVACPTCGIESPRRYGAPNVVRTPAALTEAKERSERSAYEPQVVTGRPFADAARKHPPHRLKRPWQLH